VSSALLSSCGGGGGGGSTPSTGGGGGGNGGGGNTQSVTSTLSSSGGTITLPSSGSISGATFTYPSNNITGSVKVTFTASGSGPSPYSNVRKIASASAVGSYSMTFSGASSSQSVTFNGSLELSYPGATSNLILEIFDATNTSIANPIATCNESQSNDTITFTCSGTTIANPTDTFYIEVVTGSSLVAANAFICPTSDGTSSVARGVSAASITRHTFARTHTPTTSSTGQIAVVYDRAAFQRSSASFARSEASAGGALAKTFDYPNLGKTIHVLSVPASQSAAAMTALRSQSGVLSVSAVERRHAMTANPYMVNNYYFLGTYPSNPPYYETSTALGQWDMHLIQMEYAFGYSQSGNSTGTTYPAALGSGVKIAIIDTGEDTLHPDLAANVVYQKCFITSEDGSSQSSSNYSTDPLGHGTDVSGIAAAVTNPSNPGTAQGFAGAGGNSGIMAYRVFPTPDDNCDSNSNDPQCGANATDIADAIDDAVQNGAKVISMSLGGDKCVPPSQQYPGGDDDPVEGTAVENAITAGAVVVAASGNESSNSIDVPGCDTGVIAVGATSLDDGQPTLSTRDGRTAEGTANAPVEYVTTYSNYASGTTWGIVAPGGDGYCNSVADCDNDNLHWINNIWTSTPFMANSQDTTYLGLCTDDDPDDSTSGATIAPVDCRTLIDGTSMSTPHVAGVAALICGLQPSDCTSSAMKTLLCNTADQLTDSQSASHQGCGRLNAYRAVSVALGLSDPH